MKKRVGSIMKRKYIITYSSFFGLLACIVSHQLEAGQLKILFCTNYFPEYIQPFIINQMIGLLKFGHDITILARSKENYASSFSKSMPTSMALNQEIKKYQLLKRTYYLNLPHNKRTYDLILCDQGTCGEWFIKYQNENPVQGKVLTFFRGKDITARVHEDAHRYHELFNKGVLFLPVCDYFKKLLIDIGCDPSKIVVLHAAIDCNKFKFKERTIDKNGVVRLVTAGRLVEKKGTHYAIQAVSELIKKNRNVELIIIGGGPEEKALKKLTKDLNVEKKVRFVGWKSQEDIIKILDNAHIFVFPAITAQDKDQEGIPNVVKEAMAMGLPVISTYHSGIPELVQDGVSGFLVPEKDVAGMVRRIEYLIEHAELTPQLGRAGRKRIEDDFNNEKENRKLMYICHLAALNKLDMLHHRIMEEGMVTP